MTPEEIFGAFASYLEIEYQQRTNQCKMIKDEIAKTTEVMSLFEMRKVEQDKKCVSNNILKPLNSIEESLLLVSDWNKHNKAKMKRLSSQCANLEYVTSVQDVLDKHIVVFEAALTTNLNYVKTEKSRVFDYLGVSQGNQL